MRTHLPIRRFVSALTATAVITVGLVGAASVAEANPGPTITPSPSSVPGTACTGIGAGGMQVMDYAPAGFSPDPLLMYDATGLPAGILIGPATGDFVGMPLESGSFTAHVTASNLNVLGESALADVAMTIGAFAGPSFAYTSGQFPAATVGSPSSLRVTVTNVDCVAVTVTAVHASPAAVALAGTTCVQVLDPSETCTVDLAWTPAAVGALTSGQLTLTSDAVAASALDLSGQASAAPDPAPEPAPAPVPVPDPPRTLVPPTVSATPTTTSPPATITSAQLPTTGTSTVVISSGSQQAAATCSQSSSATSHTTACGTNTAAKLYCRNVSAKHPVVVAAPRVGDGRASGLYVQVLDGSIHLTNGGGTQQFAAGQFGYSASFKQPPVVLPTNPGIKFSPPPSFTSGQGSGQSAGQGHGTGGTVDCEVRSGKGEASADVEMLVAQGGVVLVQAGGLQPKTPVSVYVGVPAVSLGNFVTDDAGQLDAWVRVPANTALGATGLQVSGRMLNDYTISVITAVTVRQPITRAEKSRVAVTAGAKKLPAAARKQLKVLLGKVPATVPVSCTVRGLPTGGTDSGRADSASSATLVKKFLATYGASCRVIKAPESGDPVVKVQMNFAS